MMPRMPPAIITHSLRDIATATRMESTAKTMSVNSTLITVDQNGREPHPRRCGFDRASVLPFVTAEEVAVREPQEIPGPDQLHEADLDQVHREKNRDDPEEERPQDPVAQRLLLIFPRQPQHQDREHQRVVGAEQPLENDEEPDRDEIRSVNVHFLLRSVGPLHIPHLAARSGRRYAAVPSGPRLLDGSPIPLQWWC